MAPQQNTFAVIPDAPGRVGGPSNRPPMTSKQAQKLYKQANKEPKRSKAEQRKWEKEKQEEIRKDLEKERAAVKAKAARDRKKAKEEEARENRRRAGQPLFDCRPSQDTIARFVRGNGTHKKRDSSGEPIPKPETTPAILVDIKPNTLASTAASNPPLPTESTEERKHPITSMAPPPRPSQTTKSAMPPPQGTSACERQPAAESVAPKPIDRDSLSRQPPTLPPTLKPLFSVPEKTPAATTAMGPPSRPAAKSKSRPFMMPKATLPTHQPPRHKIFKQNPSIQPSVHIKTEVPPPKELPSANSAPQKSLPAMPPPPVPSQKPKIEAVADKTPTNMAILAIAPSPVVVSKQMPAPPRPLPAMSPSPVPSRKSQVEAVTDKAPMNTAIPAIAPSPAAPSSVVAPSPVVAPSIQMLPPPPPRPLPQMPPPSTQAIVQDCFDDFFPTASQLAVELEEDFDSVQTTPASRSGASMPNQAPTQGPTEPFSRPKEARDLAHERILRPAKTSFPVVQKFENTMSSRHIQLAKPEAQVLVSQAPNLIMGRPQNRHRLVQGEQMSKRQRHQKTMPQGAFGPNPVANRSTSATYNTPPAKRHGAPPLPVPSRLPKLGILQELSSNHPPAPKPAAAKAMPLFDDFCPLICTQDLMMSSQEVLDIESPAKAMTQSSSGGSAADPASPLIEMDLGSIDWDDDLDDF
ncbi:hypothetical protein CSAL01_04310 [Colletotrichum salicis]|uniref:Uncharacterized protein n=1 Tax=Colletotrichum salicis TaxID=1209931 RepID=A0A135V4F3_9PEZI|nr:hypothetical protein CSAL01_04310 [Colletotrichum salicis]